MNCISFTKMTGAGNDFIMIDNRSLQVNLSPEHIARLCNRHFGIGADGVLLAQLAEEPGVDYRMRYYNADGGEAEMCGNGARCFARFVQSWARVETERVKFLTPAGLITGEYVDTQVRVNLTAPTELKFNQRADFGWGEIDYHFMNTGVPHVVLEVPDIELAEVRALGRAIRHSSLFSKGTNVNFVQILDPSILVIRTYERGVEDETLACGTGVTAAALVISRVRQLALPLQVKVRGGDLLTVGGTPNGPSFYNVTLTGPATEIFSGEITL